MELQILYPHRTRHLCWRNDQKPYLGQVFKTVRMFTVFQTDFLFPIATEEHIIYYGLTELLLVYLWYFFIPFKNYLYKFLVDAKELFSSQLFL